MERQHVCLIFQPDFSNFSVDHKAVLEDLKIRNVRIRIKLNSIKFLPFQPGGWELIMEIKGSSTNNWNKNNLARKLEWWFVDFSSQRKETFWTFRVSEAVTETRGNCGGCPPCKKGLFKCYVNWKLLNFDNPLKFSLVNKMITLMNGWEKSWIVRIRHSLILTVPFPIPIVSKKYTKLKTPLLSLSMLRNMWTIPEIETW